MLKNIQVSNDVQKLFEENPYPTLMHNMSYVYQQLCLKLTYDPFYYCLPQVEREILFPKSGNLVAAIDWDFNFVNCYILVYIYAKYLDCIGCTTYHIGYRETSYREPVHAFITIGEGINHLRIDPLTGILDGDLSQIKLNQPLNSFYYPYNKEKNAALTDIHNEVRSCLSIPEITFKHKFRNIDAKIAYLIEQSQNKLFAPVDQLAYLQHIFKNIGPKIRLNDLSFVSNNSFDFPVFEIWDMRDKQNIKKKTVDLKQVYGYGKTNFNK